MGLFSFSPPIALLTVLVLGELTLSLVFSSSSRRDTGRRQMDTLVDSRVSDSSTRLPSRFKLNRTSHLPVTDRARHRLLLLRRSKSRRLSLPVLVVVPSTALVSCDRYIDVLFIYSHSFLVAVTYERVGALPLPISEST